MESFIKIVGITVIAIAVVLVYSVILAFPIMWIWNGVITNIFGVKFISWEEAWFLYIFISLFRGTFNFKRSEKV